MATKTVVCPECGSAAAPGRYACTECGALLAAVALAPRRTGRAAAASPDDEPEPGPVVDAGAGADPEDDASRWLAADPPPTPAVELADDPPASAPGGEAAEAAESDDHDDAGPALQFDEDAPLAAAAHVASVSDVLHDLADEPPLGEDMSPDTGAPGAEPHGAEPHGAAPPTAPSWPPPGDRGPVAWPEQRTPAGSYLPPSAVLPPLDAGVAAVAAGGVAAAPVAATPAQESRSRSWADRASAGLSDAFGSTGITAAATRRAIAAGGGSAALGLLLPWVNTPPGSSPFTGYLERWGLAGPGLWLVFLGLIVLTGLALSSGRAASWPLGLAAVATAAFLMGLVWPYVVGGFGRSIGIWVIVVGAVLLFAGGLLDRRRHHDDGDAIV